MSIRNYLPALLLFGLVLGIAQRTQATVMVEIPLEDMVMDADAIVLAHVDRVGVQVALRGRAMEPWTVNSLRVDRWLKSGGSGHVLVYERGGRWEGGGMAIAGTPEYLEGEQVVVFLRIDDEGRYRTYGMVQGRFVVQQGVPGQAAIVRRDLGGVGFASWARDGGMQVEHRGATVASLDALLGRIAQVLEAIR